MDVIEGGLAGNQLLAGLPGDVVGSIERRCVWRRVPKGETVFDFSGDSRDMYFVVRGAVRIESDVRDRPIIFANIEEGGFFGELSAIDGLPRTGTVFASSDCVVASLDGEAFREYLGKYSEIGMRIIDRLTAILRSLDDRVVSLATQNESQRICRELVRLADPDPRQPGLWQIAPLPPHREIAACAGATRATVAQTLGELALDGVLKRLGGGLVILNYDRLRQLATQPP